MRTIILPILIILLFYTPWSHASDDQTLPSDRDRVEQTFKDEISRARIHLQNIYSQGLLTEQELAEGLTLTQDYQESTLLYLQSLMELQEIPDEERYLYLLEYNSGLLNMLVMNPNARMDEYTPEVMDFLPARTLCADELQNPDQCVEDLISERKLEIISSIQERNHDNEEDFLAAAAVGIGRANTYAQLVGIIHHQAENFRRSEVLDVQDIMVGSSNQDLNEGY